VPAGPRDTELPSASGYEYSPATYTATGLTPPSPTHHIEHISDVLDALDDLTSPLLGGRTVAQTAKAALNLGVEPLERASKASTQNGGTSQRVLAEAFGGALAHLVDGTQAPKIKSPSTEELLNLIPRVGTKGAPEVGPGVKDGGVFYKNPARYSNPNVVRHNNRTYAEVLNEGKFLQPNGLPPGGAAARQRKGQPNASDPLGAKTLGNATAAELAEALKNGTLRISKKGVISTPQNREALSNLKAAQKAVSASRILGHVKIHGQLSPEEIGTLLVEEGRKIGANLTPAEVAEGVGVAEAESAGNADEQRQLADFADPEEAHIGLFAEEGPSFGNVQQRLDARDATRSAIERFLADGRSWNPAWVHWQEVQGEEETGADRAPQYRSLAEGLVAAGNASRDPEAVKNLAQAKTLAREAGIDPEMVLHHKSLGPIEPHVYTRFQAALTAAKALAHGHIPYVWGGGHGAFEESPTGLDCSGAVSWVLHKIGVLNSPLTSGNMGQVLQPGPGAVTVYYNGVHTFMKIGKRFFGTSVDNSSKGLAFYGSPPQSYLETFNVGHVPGLGKKVALQLGIKPSELTAGGSGITYGNGGETATIDQGAGTEVKGGAKYSDKPIAPEGRAVSIGEVPVDEILTPGRQILTPEEEGIIQQLIARRV